MSCRAKRQVERRTDGVPQVVSDKSKAVGILVIFDYPDALHPVRLYKCQSRRTNAAGRGQLE